MNYILQFVVFYNIIFYYGTFSQYVVHIDCGSLWEVDQITVTGCSTSHNCPFYIGRNTSMSFNLIFNTDSINEQLINEVSILAGGVTFNTTVTPLDPCERLKCPVLQDNSHFDADVVVDYRFEPTYARLQWIIKTSDGETQLICFQIYVAVMN